MTPEQLDEYSARAFKFAIYPKAGTDIAYPALGLCGELAELFFKVESEVSKEILKECGDVLWYCNAIAITCGRTLGAVDIRHNLTFVDDDWQGNIAWAMATGGMVAEQAKKLIRGNEPIESRRDEILDNVSEILGVLELTVEQFSATLGIVAVGNLEKLGDREARGLIHGDGDNR